MLGRLGPLGLASCHDFAPTVLHPSTCVTKHKPCSSSIQLTTGYQRRRKRASAEQSPFGDCIPFWHHGSAVLVGHSDFAHIVEDYATGFLSKKPGSFSILRSNFDHHSWKLFKGTMS